MPDALTRTRRFTVSGDDRVHLAGCPQQGRRARPWPAFDGKTVLEVVGILGAQAGGRPCRRCLVEAPDGSEQLGLGDLLEPEAARDQGMALATAVQPPEWRLSVDATIARLAALGQPFTADDVSDITGDSPTGSQGAMGARFAHAARSGVIRRAGSVPSGRPSVRSHHVSTWVGATT